MSKSRPFSIYLLKETFNAHNALKEGLNLEDDDCATQIPPDGSLFLLDNPIQPPWWINYFGIQKPLRQGLKGAIVFIPVKNRVFALTFGQGARKLNDESYEYDFGLRVTLNCVETEKLKNIDVHAPSTDLRQRTQSPIHSNLTYLDFDKNNSILKSMSGVVQDKYQHLFKNVTGTSHVRISLKLPSDELPGILSDLIDLYASEHYRTAFPDIHNITPIKDPQILAHLNEKLVEAVRKKDPKLFLGVPDIVDYQRAVRIRYRVPRVPQRKISDDVYLDDYFEEVENSRQLDLTTIDLKDLKNHRLELLDENDFVDSDFSIFKSLIYDTNLNSENETFHFSDGNWYKVSTDFVEKLNLDVERIGTKLSLPPYNHANENAFNKDVPNSDSNFACFDQNLIYLAGETPFEMCDLFCLEQDQVNFYHVKRSTRSAGLSHLFNQGINSIELMIRVENCISDEVVPRILSKTSDATARKALLCLQGRKIKVVFAIISKNHDATPKNLPLFSRISLRRAIQYLHLLNVDVELGFIEDNSDYE